MIARRALSSEARFSDARVGRYRMDKNTTFVGVTTDSGDFLNDPTGGQRYWDVEFGDVASLTQADVKAVKSFMSMPELPPCPHCTAKLEGEYEEVDIGVGVQRHLVGWRCPNGCPFGVGVCNSCGVPTLPDVVHHKWCQEQR